MSDIPVIFGEVLFDCFSDGSKTLGGAPFNVAWHLQAFGCKPLLVSRIGDDENGSLIIKTMKKWGMSTDHVQLDSLYPTGVVEVSFSNGEPSYDIVENSAWDFIDKIEASEKLKGSNLQDVLLYHGSLALRNNDSFNALKVLGNQISTAFLDINLRPPYYSSQLVLDLFSQQDRVKINDDELIEVYEMIMVDQSQKNSFAEEKKPLGSNETSPVASVAKIDVVSDEVTVVKIVMNEFSLKYLLLTKGSKGATVYLDTGESFSVEPEVKIEVVDTVGAGDGFTSVVILGYLSGWSNETTLKRAQQFAAKIVGQRGATTQDPAFYTSFKKEWNL